MVVEKHAAPGPYFMFYSMAKQIWDAMKKHFSHEQNALHFYIAYNGLFAMRQYGRSLKDYFGTIQYQAEELNLYQRMKINKQIKQRDDLMSARFLSWTRFHVCYST